MTVHHGAFQKSEADPLLAPIVSASLDKPYVIAQLGQSLDGRIATATGESRWINRSAALDHLHRLRAHVDAVVVGVGTVVEDDPELTVRRVKGRNPARVVIDPNGRMPRAARCLADNGVQRIVITSCERVAAPVQAERLCIPKHGTVVDPHAIVAKLAEMGFRKILIEGGATTISRFIDAGAIDRLHLLVAPMILGSGVSGLNLRPIACLTDAHRPATSVHVLDDGDVLFDCDMRLKDKG